MSSATTWPLSCVRQREPLANHTSFRIGGPADWYAEPSTTEELLLVLRRAHELGIAVCPIGGGTNLLVSDRGIGGLVVRLGKGFRRVDILEEVDHAHVRVRCGAAVMTQHLVTLAAQHGWAGLETLAGLPGQLGGAVTMNAQSIGQFVERVSLTSFRGDVDELPRERLHFAYRYAALEPGVILDVTLRFPKAPVEESAEKIKQVLCRRNDTQDVRLPSAGCAFKNPPGESAGRLIDQAGLKGLRIGDAQVSLRHANFIVNLGYATCDDVLALMEHVQGRVFKQFGIRLEPEVRMLGERVGSV